MSIAIDTSIHDDPILAAVGQQAARFARSARRTLVFCCVEQRGQSWARALDDVAYVSGDFSDLEDVGVLESLCAAVEAFEIEELVLVAHTGCRVARRADAGDPDRPIGRPSSDPRALLAGYASDLERGKDDVKRAVKRLRERLGDEVQLTGAIELGSSGQLLGYLEGEEDFRKVG